METYDVQLSEDVALFLHCLDEKSKRICKKNLKKLEHPYPGRGSGDKEKLVIKGEEMYRLYIGCTLEEHTLLFMWSWKMKNQSE